MMFEDIMDTKKAKYTELVFEFLSKLIVDDDDTDKDTKEKEAISEDLRMHVTRYAKLFRITMGYTTRKMGKRMGGVSPQTISTLENSENSEKAKKEKKVISTSMCLLLLSTLVMYINNEEENRQRAFFLSEFFTILIVDYSRIINKKEKDIYSEKLNQWYKSHANLESNNKIEITELKVFMDELRNLVPPSKLNTKKDSVYFEDTIKSDEYYRRGMFLLQPNSGNPFNLRDAKLAFEKSVEYNPKNQESWFQLAMLYMFATQQIQPNSTKAFECFIKASSLDNSLYYLGHCYYYGIGTEKDEQKGLSLLVSNASRGNLYSPYSADLLSRIYLDKFYTIKNKANLSHLTHEEKFEANNYLILAKQYNRAACEKGLQSAQMDFNRFDLEQNIF